jgi:DNA-directed RNA polymerase subunit RPC12/RpoP
VSGRIVLHLDPGLGWTKPLMVACCGLCGAELARHPNPDRALRAARGRRCPACGTRSGQRLPGTPSLATRPPRRSALPTCWKEVSPPCPPPRPG